MSGIEEHFAFLLRIHADLPEAVREYRFHQERRWRFDFAWPEARVAVECQGGIWSGGRHSRGAGQEGDYEKHNTAVSLGWKVLYVTSNMLDNPDRLLAWLQDALSQTQNDFVTVGEAARIMGRHPGTVYRLLQTGKLRGVAIGDGKRKQWRVPRSAVQQFLAERDRVRKPTQPVTRASGGRRAGPGA